MKGLIVKLVAAALLVTAGAFCCGMFERVETTYVTHTVKSGETLNGIAAKYYHSNTKGYISQRDYAMMVRVENNNLYNMERQLQIGDAVRVPIYTRK